MSKFDERAVDLLQAWIDEPPDEDARDAFIQFMKSAGWTPPVEKEKFKKGDYVELSYDFTENVNLDRFVRKNTVDGTYEGESFSGMEQCRHAPTWIKWEEGLMESGQYLLVEYFFGRYGLLDPNGKPNGKVKRWAYLPLEE